MFESFTTILAAGDASGFGLDTKLILSQVVNFTIVALILWFTAFKKITGTMDERQKKIADGLQYAEEMNPYRVSANMRSTVAH